MYSTCLSIMSLVLLTTPLARGAPVDPKAEDGEEEGEGVFWDGLENPELGKRLSSFVRIGRPSSFVRIGRGSHFVRIGRPGNFVRIGRGGAMDADELSEAYPGLGDALLDNEKRASRFVRIGKASRFVRIGRGDGQKRLSSFVRIGKADPSAYALNDDSNNDSGDNNLENDKRASSFVRIGKIPSSAFVRIGRGGSGGAMGGEGGDMSGAFDRIARMGQSSFVRIGKREAEHTGLSQAVVGGGDQEGSSALRKRSAGSGSSDAGLAGAAPSGSASSAEQ